MKKWLPHPLLTVLLTLFWLLLHSQFSIGDFLLGAFLGWVIPLITHPLWPRSPTVLSYRKLMLYLLLVAKDIVVANLIVARLILFKASDQLNTRWVSLPLEIQSPEALAMLAATITLTPGTVSSDFSADGKSLLVHCLDAAEVESAVQSMKTRYEARLKEIFP